MAKGTGQEHSVWHGFAIRALQYLVLVPIGTDYKSAPSERSVHCAPELHLLREI